MRKTIILFLILFSSFAFSQSEEFKYEFRQVFGNLKDELGDPLPGQNIIIKGTDIGTQTDLFGDFCLIIPKDKTVYIELPFCFEQIFREVNQVENNVHLSIGKEKIKSKKAKRNWLKIKEILIPDLLKFYKSEEFEIIKTKFCN